MSRLKIWVTRTEPSATRVANELSDHGFDCHVEPLLKIEALHNHPPPGSFDLVIYLSAHAVASSIHPVQGMRATIAIGPGTANRLRHDGVAAELPRVYSSEGVLDLIKTNHRDVDRVLIVCGKLSRSHLKSELQRLGIEVSVTETYERISRNLDFGSAYEKCAVILLESLDALNALQHWLKENDPNDPNQKCMIVPSERIALVARKAGRFEVILSKDATTKQTITTLCQVINHD